MNNKLSGWGDTIVAIATPPGIGAIGVLRLSGELSFDIIQKLFPSKNLKEQAANTLHVGYLKEGKNVLDEVVVSLFKKPLSYTGEDVIEISCHGSPYVQQQVLDALIRNGARLAKAGEFTQRAFLNKKLDLTQAEAVGDLIASNTKASQNAALNNMRGGFSNVLQALREEMIKFSSLIELELDFSEEDVEFADRHQFSLLIKNINTTVNQLLESFKLGNVIKNGVSVAIVGKPNAGKSTLLNTLLNENRAIVSEIAGTTRDTIEETININGILFRLIDTAGIREHSQDVIENMGVVKSKEKIKQANIVLYLFDVNEMNSDELSEIVVAIKHENSNVLTVANKTDLAMEPVASINNENSNQILISAKENRGIENLKDKLFGMAVGSGLNTENIVITNARHYSAL
ncbi:MAG: tRNA uridine-5-carboxymethylaminomethyl(34) synthesis GTPase MnmE, partial [Ginsengibacter sp.]